MKLKAVSGIMLTLLLISMSTLAFNIQRVRASGTIYIRPDGSVEGTDMIQRVGDVYTFTDNIYDKIVVERDNIVVDGAGYTVQGGGGGTGIYLSYRNNVTIKNVEVTNFNTGIYLSDSSNNTLAGNTISSNNDDGIWLGYSSNNTLTSNNASNNDDGILLFKSSNNTLAGNTVFANNKYGISLYISSNNNTITGNTASNNQYGIDLGSSTNNNTITGNTASNNQYGIKLFNSSNNTLAGNTISSNNDDGIRLYSSSNNVLTGNNASNNKYNFWVYGWLFSHFNNYVDTSNTVDGKPIYYLIGVADAVYDAETNAGTIYLINSNNITIKDLTLTKNYFGALFFNTTNSKIENVTASNNNDGIYLRSSSNNTLAGNTASSNYEYGIDLDYPSNNNVLSGNTASNNWIGINLRFSSNNVLFHNNLISNTFQASAYPTKYVNTWDDGYPSGGNYWSNYTGVDVKSGSNQDQPNSDGIGDTPYIIDVNNTDHYPLMYPWGSPPPPSHSLTVHSEPIGVTFTVDGVSRTTPWSGTYSENASVSLVMPKTHNGFVWSHWLEDGDTNRTNTVNMNTNITLTGVFTPVPPIATVDIDPNTLNLKSRGKWITCYIELPKGYDVSDIDRTTILLNGTIPVDPFWIDKPLESVIGDYDNDTLRDLMVKFSRKAVSEFILSKGIMYGNVTLTITGELYDGSLFEGGDVIKVGMPSNVNSDDDECVDIYDIAIPEFSTWTSILLILIVLTVAIAIYKRRLIKKPIH